MKAVKCIYKGGTTGLTIGKIYEVIESSDDFVIITDDYGIKSAYYIKDTDGIWFVDATADIREEKLNNLGIL